MPSLTPTPTRRTTLWLLFGTYFAGTSLLHLQLSIWLVSPADLPFGRIRPADYLPVAVGLAGAGLAIAVIRQAWRGERRLVTVAYWVLWGLAALAADRVLFFTANEYAHYPQYALLAYLLAYCLDPGRQQFLFGRVLFWTTALGMIDELGQYLLIAAPYGEYLDFNDFILNLLGAAAGVLAYYGFREPAAVGSDSGDRGFTPELGAVGLVTAGLALLMLFGTLRLTPPRTVPPGGVLSDPQGTPTVYLERKPGILGSWRPAKHWDHYYVLHPLEGLGLLVLAGMGFASFTRWPTNARAPAPEGRHTAP